MTTIGQGVPLLSAANTTAQPVPKAIQALTGNNASNFTATVTDSFIGKTGSDKASFLKEVKEQIKHGKKAINEIFKKAGIETSSLDIKKWMKNGEESLAEFCKNHNISKESKIYKNALNEINKLKVNTAEMAATVKNSSFGVKAASLAASAAESVKTGAIAVKNGAKSLLNQAQELVTKYPKHAIGLTLGALVLCGAIKGAKSIVQHTAETEQDNRMLRSELKMVNVELLQNKMALQMANSRNSSLKQRVNIDRELLQAMHEAHNI